MSGEIGKGFIDLRCTGDIGCWTFSWNCPVKQLRKCRFRAWSAYRTNRYGIVPFFEYLVLWNPINSWMELVYVDFYFRQKVQRVPIIFNSRGFEYEADHVVLVKVIVF